VGGGVAVGGIGDAVLVAVGSGVFVLVRVGMAVGRFVAVEPGPGRRVLVGEKIGLNKVRVGRGVVDGVTVRVLVGAAVLVGGAMVGVVRYSGTAATVNAAAVFRLEIAISSRLTGSKSTDSDCVGPPSAMAETTQNRLKPRAPAASTPRGPE